MPNRLELTVAPEAADEEGLLQAAARSLGVAPDRISAVIPRRRSVDARHRKVLVNYSVDVYVDEPHEERAIELPPLPALTTTPSVVVIGAGPAGLFAAWCLASKGVRSIVVERGSDVRGRRPALAQLNRDGRLNPESNYCFGEGGAGTFSDGKLYTRVKKGPIRQVMELLVGAGAPAKILVETRPHIGTNRLPKVIATFREYLKAAGVEFMFDTRVERLSLNGEQIAGVELDDGRIVSCRSVVLATGHSARDVYRTMLSQGVPIESKPLAIGVRIEHPQGVIDGIQYGAHAGHTNLGAAPYSLKRTVDGVGVYSFCMCPGGFIVPASTEEGHVVVNGMSPSKRDSEFANSGMVVTVDQAVFGDGPLDGVEYQSRIEKAAFSAGGGRYVAPAQRVTDFVAGRLSQSLPRCSYRPGLAAADLTQVLPERIWSPLKDAFGYFGARRMRGYLTEEAVLVGVESRSSSPVRILRETDTLESPGISGLYPCGEGAGYAGGIMSAALDGLRVANAIAAK